MRVVPRRLTLLVSLSLAACTEQVPGGPCEQRFTDLGLCYDTTALIICSGGKYVRYPCTGPNGCVQKGNAWSCDFRGAAEGDACPSVLDGLQGCGTDGVSALTCTSNHWKRSECRVCTNLGTSIRCVPKAGTGCTADDPMTCDGNTLLSCEAGTWQGFACTGTAGCSPALLANPSKAYRACDFTGTDAGAPCPATFEHLAGTCASGTEYLDCHFGAFVSVPCTTCTTSDGGVPVCT